METIIKDKINEEQGGCTIVMLCVDLSFNQRMITERMLAKENSLCCSYGSGIKHDRTGLTWS